MKQRNLYQRFFFPLLSRLDAEANHDRTMSALALAQNNAAGRSLLQHIRGALPQQPVQLFGLTFPNVLGVAAGFDKEGQAVAGLALLGFGHIEVGTITPLPQNGNPRPRVFRLAEDKAIINRMGFPNSGAQSAAQRLVALPDQRPYVVGVSIGKQKETPLANAAEDYCRVMTEVLHLSDYLAVNISSPNTPELRQLQGSAYLGDLLQTLAQENESLAARRGIEPRPLLIKIAPDLSVSELDSILRAALDHQVAGIIATNTTVSRPDLNGRNRQESGGLSGKPLGRMSLHIIQHISRETAGRLPVIGAGGIASASDVCARLEAGAALVQIYTALVFRGPGLPGQILRELAHGS